jgi:hypothetical protein
MINLDNQDPDFGSLMGLPKLAPSLQHYLAEDGQPFIIEHPQGIKLLAFQLDPMDLWALPCHDREILRQVLLQEEFHAEYLLLNIPFDKTRGRLKYIDTIHELLLLCAPDENALPQTYLWVKHLIKQNDLLRIGILFSNTEETEAATACFQHLANGVRKFLGVSIHSKGILPPFHTLQNPAPPRIDSPFVGSAKSRLPDTMIRLGERIVRGEGFNPYLNPTPFFEKILTFDTRENAC